MDLSVIGVFEGDSIAVFDGILGRMTVFDSESDAVRVFSMGGEWVRHVVGDGSVIAATVMFPSWEPGVLREEVRLLYRPHTESESRVLRGFDGTEYYFAADAMYMELLPFGARFRTATTGPLVYVSGSQRYQIEGLDLAGQTAVLLRGTGQERNVTGRDLDRYVAELAAESRDPKRQADLERMRREAPHGDVKAAHGELLGSTTGELWVEDGIGRPGEEGRVWRVFGADQLPKASVVSPAGFQILYVDDSVVGGVWRDGQDREYIRFHEIVR